MLLKNHTALDLYRFKVVEGADSICRGVEATGGVNKTLRHAMIYGGRLVTSERNPLAINISAVAYECIDVVVHLLNLDASLAWKTAFPMTFVTPRSG